MSATTFLMVNSVANPDEWDAMWSRLAAHWKGDFSDYNARYGEAWQYMGTQLTADTWEHVFRHRMHPKTNRREYHRVLASPQFHDANPIQPAPKPRPYVHQLPAFDPIHCGGAFDGIRVISDADPCL